MRNLLLPTIFLFVTQINATEGFFKDYFHDQGYNLSGQKHNDHVRTLLGFTIEPNISTTISISKNRLVGTAIDSNGVLLYPDNSPRFRVFYHSGGHFNHLDAIGGEVAYDRLRTFVANGGSWVGSCAGAGAASLAAYPGGPTMVGVWPHYYQDKGDKYMTTLLLTDLTHPIAQYYCDFLGYTDSLVDSTWFSSGGFFPDDYDPPYNYTRYLAKYTTTGYNSFGKWSVIAYKDTTRIHSGAVVITGAHPETGRAGTKRGKYFAAMCKHAALENGKPRIKGGLLNDVARVMNDNEKFGFEKIGDRQYHHFTVFVPEEAETLAVTMAGESGYDFNLYLKKESYAFSHVASHSNIGDGENKEIVLTKNNGLSKGLWFVGVECATEVTIVETRQKPDTLGIDSIQYDAYSGKTGVLNGVAYAIKARMDYIDVTPPTAPSELTFSADTVKPVITLSWNDASDNETGVAYYHVYRNGTMIATALGNSYRDNSSGLQIGKSYTYSVGAVNGAGLEGDAALVAASTSVYMVIDDGDNSTHYKTGSTGAWTVSTIAGGFGVGSVYSREVGATYTWEGSVCAGELHSVEIWYTAAGGRNGAVPVSIYDGETQVFSTVLNQKVNGSRWIKLTDIVFNDSAAKVVVTSTNADSASAADAIRFTLKSGMPTSLENSDGSNLSTTSTISISPNPFNPSTILRIPTNFAREKEIKVSVFDSKGSLVDIVRLSMATSGASIRWNASNKPGGLYFFKVSSGKNSTIVKAMLIK